jgi:hypothetical protein
MLVDKLRKYFKETPHEQLVKEWNELDDWKDVGPTAEEFIKFWNMEELDEFRMEDIEDCTWGILVFDPINETEEGIEIVHWVGYWEEPGKEEFDDLKRELSEDDQFELVDIADRLEYTAVDGDTFREILEKY